MIYLIVSPILLFQSLQVVCSDITHAASKPTFFHEVVQSPKWKITMDTEIAALANNHTWTATHLPLGKDAVGCKWIYKIKNISNKSIKIYKDRPVSNGFTQVNGLDFTETFSPIIKFTIVRLAPGLDVVQEWHILQLEVINAFLPGYFQEDVYKQLQPVFHNKGESGTGSSSSSLRPLVCQLNKSLLWSKTSF